MKILTVSEAYIRFRANAIQIHKSRQYTFTYLRLQILSI